MSAPEVLPEQRSIGPGVQLMERRFHVKEAQAIQTMLGLMVLSHGCARQRQEEDVEPQLRFRKRAEKSFSSWKGWLDSRHPCTLRTITLSVHAAGDLDYGLLEIRLDYDMYY